jgi:hypothetical protein
VNQALDWFGGFTFMFETPKALSYGHFVVVQGYQWCLGLMGGLAALALVLHGYRLLRESVRGGTGGVWLWSGALWDLLIALSLALLGFPLLSQAIELSNQIARGILWVEAGSSAGALMPNPDVWGIELAVDSFFSALRIITAPLAWIVFAVVALVVFLLLSLVRLVQLALLDLLLLLWPVWALAWATPGFRPYGLLATRLFIELLLIQILQDAAVGLGAALIGGFGHASATPLTLLVGLATCSLAFRMSSLVSRSVQEVQRALPGAGEQVATLLTFWLS